MTPTQESYRLIQLTRGQFAKVDAEDFTWLSQLKWCASYSTSGFYALSGVNVYGKKTTVTMHRLIMNIPRKNGLSVDHINHDGLDNRKCNLRVVTHAENMRNTRLRTDSSTGYKGVQKSRDKFMAMLTCHGKTHYIGSFDTPLEAALARDKVAIEVHGEFALLNFPALSLIST